MVHERLLISSSNSPWVYRCLKRVQAASYWLKMRTTSLFASALGKIDPVAFD